MPLSIETEDSTIEYEAVNVLYVPKLTDRLISIGEITREGHKVIFNKNALRVELEKGDSFMVEWSRGMYALKAIPRIIDEQALVNKTEAIDKASLWHYRLAHPGRNIARQLGFDVLGSKCKVCEMAKSHRQPFNKQISRAQEALQRVYSDVLGPLSPEAQGKY